MFSEAVPIGPVCDTTKLLLLSAKFLELSVTLLKPVSVSLFFRPVAVTVTGPTVVLPL